MTDQPDQVDVEIDVDVEDETGEKYDGGEIPEAPDAEPQDVPPEEQNQ